MKKNISFPKTFLLSILLMMMVFTSCKEEDMVEYPAGESQVIADPFLQIQTQVVPFQAGTEKYGIKFNVINGVKNINEVNVYAVFTPAVPDTVPSISSEKTFMFSYPVNSSEREIIIDSLDYAALKTGITVKGEPLPESEFDLAVGSGWKLTFEGVRPDGSIVPLVGAIQVAVLSPYAGLYKVLIGEYERFDGLTGDYTGQERFIGSVDATTFSYNDYWGYFAWAGKSFRFKLNEEDNTIVVPILVNGDLFSGIGPIGCTTDASSFINKPCEGSNILVPDNVTGKHKIYLTYGYMGTNGSREFYEVLEKITD